MTNDDLNKIKAIFFMMQKPWRGSNTDKNVTRLKISQNVATYIKYCIYECNSLTQCLFVGFFLFLDVLGSLPHRVLG